MYHHLLILILHTHLSAHPTAQRSMRQSIPPIYYWRERLNLNTWRTAADWFNSSALTGLTPLCEHEAKCLTPSLHLHSFDLKLSSLERPLGRFEKFSVTANSNELLVYSHGEKCFAVRIFKNTKLEMCICFARWFRFSIPVKSVHRWIRGRNHY